MSVWRSPLLYLGIVIILLVTAALVAPWFVDFNRYRERISAWGAELTGRPVKIRGDIEVRFFPWPTITLNDVTVANPPEASQPAFLEADRITARLSLAALLSGRLEVERVDFTRPQLVLERLKDGSGTWKLKPHRGVHLPFPPERIAIAGIHIHDGTVLLADTRRGGMARIDAISATITAPRLIGPWRLVATARMQNRPVTIRISTGRIHAHNPVSFAARLEPTDGDGLSWSLSGEWNSPKSGRMQADLRVVPVFGQGKADRATGLMLYAVNARVEGNLDDIWMRKIEAAPLSSAHAANTITGQAHIVIGPLIKAALSLKAGRFDLDWLTGKDARASLFNPQGLKRLVQLPQKLPPDVLLRLDLSVSALRIGGETLNKFHAFVEADTNHIAIKSLATTLPGGSELAFHGQILTLPDMPQLSGDVDFESRSLRDLVFWALPALRPALSRLWRGARGQLTLKARVDVSPTTLRLSEGRFRLDRSQGTLDLTFGDGALDLSVDAKTLDIDHYIPSGLAAPDREGNPGTALFELIAAAMRFGDTHAEVKAERLNLWGLPMKGVDIALGITADKAQISRFDIADLAGARIQAEGTLTFPNDTVKGDVSAHITAQKVGRLWRLLSGYQEQEAPDWLDDLGDMNLAFKATAKEIVEGAHLKAILKGNAGPLRIDARTDWRGRLSRWRKGRIDVRADIFTPHSTPLVALLRNHAFSGKSVQHLGNPVETQPRMDPPAQARLIMKGRPDTAVNTTLSLELAGIDLRFEGSLRNVNAETGWTGQGRLAIRTTHAPDALTLLGMGAPASMPNTIWAEAIAAFSPEHARLRKLHGNVGETTFAGELHLKRSEEDLTRLDISPTDTPAWRIDGRIDTEFLEAAAMLRPLLTTPTSPDGRFRSKVLENLPLGRIDLNAAVLAVLPGLHFKKGKLRIEHNRAGLSLTLEAGSPPRADRHAQRDRSPLLMPQTPQDGLALTARIRQARTGLVVSGRARMALIASQHLIRADGTPLFKGIIQAEVSLNTAGRSLLSLPANLEGSGNLVLSPGQWPRLAPVPFLEAAARLDDARHLTALVESILLGRDTALPFPGASLPMKIEAGVMTLAPFSWQPRPGLTVHLRALADAHKAAFDISLDFIPEKAKDDQPGFTLVFTGPPHALQKIPQLDALRDWITVTALKRSMAELERIERERRRILEEESAFERRQVLFERWRQWAEEKARQQAAFRARIESLLEYTEKARRTAARKLKRIQEREAFRRKIERQRRMLREHQLKPRDQVKERRRQSETGQSERSTSGKLETGLGSLPSSETTTKRRKSPVPSAPSVSGNENPGKNLSIEAILRALQKVEAPKKEAGGPGRPAASNTRRMPAPFRKAFSARPAGPTGIDMKHPAETSTPAPPTPRNRPGSKAGDPALPPATGTSVTPGRPIRIVPLPPPRPERRPYDVTTPEKGTVKASSQYVRTNRGRRPRVITNFGARH